jgi:hypothetical protein
MANWCSKTRGGSGGAPDRASAPWEGTSKADPIDDSVSVGGSMVHWTGAMHL